MTGEVTATGVFDYWLGGSSHLRADRELGQQIAARWPSVPVLVRAAQDFHLRAAAWCAERGVTRFVRLGTATFLPGRNVHDAVRRVNPGARVAYMARQTDALALGEGLLGAKDGIAAFRGTADDPAAVLAAAPVAEMLASREPLCVIFGLVLHFVPPARAAEVVAQYAAALPRGSFIALSVMVTADREAAREFRGMFTVDPVYPPYPWSVRDVRHALSGLELVPPGVAEVHKWPARTRWAGRSLEGTIPVRGVGAVARKRLGDRAQALAGGDLAGHVRPSPGVAVLLDLLGDYLPLGEVLGCHSRLRGPQERGGQERIILALRGK